jgi:Restriction endonuclease
MPKSPGFLTWRSSEDADHINTKEGPFGVARYCPYCSEVLVDESVVTADWQGNVTGLNCYFCGWFQWYMAESWCSLYDEEQFKQAILIDLEPNNPSLVESEIRAALVADSKRSLLLTPRRFEEVVSGIYKDLGYRSVLTRSSKDGGRDVILWGKSSEDNAIVEVKRYKDRIGVEFVRQLRGVQLREGAPRAILVSASGFTTGALSEAKHPGPARHGFVMELADISDLLSELGLTSEPLANISAIDRDRTPYRAWFAETFNSGTSHTGNPQINSGGPETIVAGWWRASTSE